jgi:predicted phosphodiesterase
VISRQEDYRGLLVIGDPHLEGRQPGFRKDDYPNVILEKLEWCLQYARRNQLLPTLLGDLFQNPRDNPTWMLSRLIGMLRDSGLIGIYGNHDCAEPVLTDNDSLMILIKSGCLRLVDYQNPWSGVMNGRTVYVGGSSYRQIVPEKFELVKRAAKKTLFESDPLVIWLAHHDVDIPGYDAGRFKPHEIENVDLLINGHIHKRLDSVQVGQTLWMTPGNISRRSRSERSRNHVPRAVRIDVGESDYEISDVVVPFQPFEEVFHDPVADADCEPDSSDFVTGLKELQARRTQSGAGLHEFLAQNLGQFAIPVAREIEILANQIMQTGNHDG